MKTDFAWGLLAILALRQGDRMTAACWLREALPLRQGQHWTVTDEVARQILKSHLIDPAKPSDACG